MCQSEVRNPHQLVSDLWRLRPYLTGAHAIYVLIMQWILRVTLYYGRRESRPLSAREGEAHTHLFLGGSQTLHAQSIVA